MKPLHDQLKSIPQKRSSAHQNRFMQTYLIELGDEIARVAQEVARSVAFAFTADDLALSATVDRMVQGQQLETTVLLSDGCPHHLRLGLHAPSAAYDPAFGLNTGVPGFIATLHDDLETVERYVSFRDTSERIVDQALRRYASNREITHEMRLLNNLPRALAYAGPTPLPPAD